MGPCRGDGSASRLRTRLESLEEQFNLPADFVEKQDLQGALPFPQAASSKPRSPRHCEVRAATTLATIQATACFSFHGLWLLLFLEGGNRNRDIEHRLPRRWHDVLQFKEGERDVCRGVQSLIEWGLIRTTEQARAPGHSVQARAPLRNNDHPKRCPRART